MTNKEVKSTIENLKAVQNITDIYQQVAAMRMRRVKDGITRNRIFYQKLSDIYLETQRCSKTKTSSRKTNGKSVSVLLSSNTGLYGSVINNVFSKFTQEAVNSNDDIVITGQLGKNWFRSLMPKKAFKYFDNNDGMEGLDEQLKLTFDHISNYSNIKIYHGLFKSIVEQPANVTTITEQIQQTNTETQIPFFIFEPSVEKVLETFEKQLLYSFFNQAAYESALSKYGSRMLSLDSATQNVSKMLQKTTLVSTKMRHRIQNKKQLEALNSWRAA